MALCLGAVAFHGDESHWARLVARDRLSVVRLCATVCARQARRGTALVAVHHLCAQNVRSFVLVEPRVCRTATGVYSCGHLCPKCNGLQQKAGVVVPLRGSAVPRSGLCFYRICCLAAIMNQAAAAVLIYLILYVFMYAYAEVAFICTHFYFWALFCTLY